MYFEEEGLFDYSKNNLYTSGVYELEVGVIKQLFKGKYFLVVLA